MNIFDDLCEALCLSKSELLRFASSSPHRYKVYSINKRNSKGKRIIAHPSKELKFIQRYLIKILVNELKVHDSAYAYKKKTSIKDNAEQHLHSKYLLKMDFTEFFPSITPELFFKCTDLHNVNFNDVDKSILTRLLFWKSRKKNSLILSIGAPSSPLISNFIMLEFDQIISDFCKVEKINYTRYADDITFSTNRKGLLFSIPQKVNDLLMEVFNGSIEVNNEKTVFTSKAHNRHVTGITLTNDDTLSIGRERKRIISATIHKFSLNLLADTDVARLQGDISYATHIEPEFLERMTKKYGHEILDKIKNSLQK